MNSTGHCGLHHRRHVQPNLHPRSRRRRTGTLHHPSRSRLPPSKPFITVLLRTLDSSSSARLSLEQTLPSLDVSITYRDLTSPPSVLALIFATFDIVISASGFVGGPGTRFNLCRAALESGVGWYIPWQFGVDYDLIGRGSCQPGFDEQLDVRDRLRSQSKMRWTIISTGIFSSFLFEPFFGIVNLEGRTVTALGAWENPITMTSAEDIGRLTARIVLDNNDSGVGRDVWSMSQGTRRPSGKWWRW